jgi:hypothetical protein
VPDLPRAKKVRAAQEIERFRASYGQFLGEILERSLVILLLSKNPRGRSPFAKLCRRIRKALDNVGHFALFSDEEVPGVKGKGLSEKAELFAKERAADLIINLVEGAPDGESKVDEFCTHRFISYKFILTLPARYQALWEAVSQVHHLEKVSKGQNVCWYEAINVRRRTLMQETVRIAQVFQVLYATGAIRRNRK